ncbi:3-hydroxyacyl-CoA dehydrogenase [Mycobacterium sp. KBS0706]|uniref:3-hydroxyacyl-CoA dehydrogenase n=1 Tax=Mycobacterium sp. KBS0706 TaxID=2578109 RepID=UPI00110F9954|nr:3-hydroxyacyl-CoA dehydrogenase [Mycobacterium sp. KBS0706]TSD89442.1 3-hydroxyacyl-CoA dehydrogenase [Mycobacterium sp. KBS0706]
MPTVAIIGTGLIGRSWAIVFAAAGWQVRLIDASPAALQAAPGLIVEGLADLAGHGLVDDPGGAAARVRIAGSLADAVVDAELVQENLPEDLEIKRAVFAELDRLAPRDSILASSTSAIVASRFTEDLAGRERCLVAHPVNPPHLVPVVELCGAPWTTPETIERALAIYRAVGQEPVTIHREVDGFVLNRLQGALLAEAFRLVGDGVISPQDLDKTIQDGLGLRWSFLGPFGTIELNAPGGIPDYCARYTGFYRRLAADPAGPEVWGAPTIERLLAGWGEAPDPARLAARSVWRDRRLAALKAHKAAQPAAPTES